MIQGHGGNTFQLAKRLGCAVSDIVDMSSNVNPLGPPPGFAEFFKENAHLILSLPEADAGSAVTAWAGLCGLDRSQVVPGNGSTELIYLIPRALGIRSALIVGPTYADYADACRLAGAAVDFWFAGPGNGFVPDIERIGRAIGSRDAVFICNPNNPTGVLIPAPDLERLCRARENTLFIIDESYLPFAGDPVRGGMAARGLANVVVLSSMSKIFRLPGLRLGFAAGPADLMDNCRRLTLPWAQNALAQAAVVYLVENESEMEGFVQISRTFLDREKDKLAEAIRGMTGVESFASRTSFVLCRLGPGQKAAELWKALAGQRILIRDCANFPGLDERYFRISMKLAPENRLLAGALERFFAWEDK